MFKSFRTLELVILVGRNQNPVVRMDRRPRTADRVVMEMCGHQRVVVCVCWSFVIDIIVTEYRSNGVGGSTDEG